VTNWVVKIQFLNVIMLCKLQTYFLGTVLLFQVGPHCSIINCYSKYTVNDKHLNTILISRNGNMYMEDGNMAVYSV
jgi:hypothetical protein